MKFQFHRATFTLLFFSQISLSATLQYPEIKKCDVVDYYFGEAIADPYQWLENDVRKDPEVATFVEKQNATTASFFDKIKARESIHTLVTNLFNYERVGAPLKRGNYYTIAKNDGLQNQSIIYKLETLEAEPRILIDPNHWSEDGTIALEALSFTGNGNLVAIGRSSAGSDWSEIVVMNALTGEMLSDHLSWISAADVSWTPDNLGFYYATFPKPEKGDEYQQLNYDCAVYYHKISTEQSEDTLVFHSPENRKWFYYQGITEDEKFLIITAAKSTEHKNRIWAKDLHEPTNEPLEVITTWENEWLYLANDDFTFFFLTDLNAPQKRIVSFDIRQGPQEAIEIIPQSNATLISTTCVNNQFVCTYLKDALPQVKIFNMDGSLVRDVELPGIGSVSGFVGSRCDQTTFYTFNGLNMPTRIYQYEMKTGESTLYFSSKSPFESEMFDVSQIFYSSKDGTKIPMLIAHKKGIVLDGTNPTLLYGYGGFNISLPTSFNPGLAAWMMMGGVYAQPNLRGGGEYGNAWHEAGKKEKKQNVFDDFIAAAEWLIEKGYTQPKKLAISGGSNGGLLVGAMITQRPKLFAAALPQVGVLDMLRFHRWTSGRHWTEEYGCSENPEEFQFLKAYSPYHNLESGVEYPATLVMTADTDDRVVPGHSFKFAARLQEVQKGDNPILIRIESNSGHGAGTPLSKIINQFTDKWTFLADRLEITNGF